MEREHSPRSNYGHILYNTMTNKYILGRYLGRNYGYENNDGLAHIGLYQISDNEV